MRSRFPSFGRHAAVRIGSTALVLLICAAPAAAQVPPVSPEQSALGLTTTADTLRDLPLGENVYAVLETMQPEAIADRFNSGGLNIGEPSRVGAFLASWSQTLFRVGDIDVTDPAGSGSPLVFPETQYWQQVDVATGLMPISVNAPGLAVTLEPRRPTAGWTTTVSAFGTGGTLASSTPNGPVPPIARLQDWAHASAMMSGPMAANRAGIIAGGSWTRGSKFYRESLSGRDSDLASGFVHFAFTPSVSRQLRTLAWIQRSERPFEYWRAFSAPDASTQDMTVHAQSSWEQRSAKGVRWRVFGGFTRRAQRNELPAGAAPRIERLSDGPVSPIVESASDTTSGRWMIGARVAPIVSATSPHAVEVGADVNVGILRSSDQFTGAAGELVNSTPARLWVYTSSSGESKRHARTVAAFLNDTIKLSQDIGLDVGVRFESVKGNAEGAAEAVSWQTVLPRAALRWEFGAKRHDTLILGYRRAANRLNLDVLAFGDPAASTALVARWIPSPISAPPAFDLRAAIIARVGPGTGGDAAFSRIDPDLKRPYTDEFVVGMESRPRPSLRFGITGIARREANLMGVVNTGVPVSSYSVIGIPDQGKDLPDPSDDQNLVVYDRLPSSFGKDLFLLTNPGQEAATLYAFTLTAQRSTDRMFLFLGATASAASGSAAGPAFGPLDNDQDRLGDAFISPNVATFARGRLFSDRAFTGKWTTVYRFPSDFRVGIIARYQDGQPFSRLVITPNLNQGPEAVHAYPNGGNRFTYTGTLDLRFQKGFTVGTAHLDTILDFYNLLTRANEVEENPVTGAAFRTPTAIEPPHAIHLGVRLTF